jgi:hypothetical protein
MVNKIIIAILSFAPVLVWAVGDECINEHNENLKQLCLAKEHASAGYCDKITSMGTKIECIMIVRNRQRELTWSVKPIDMSKVVSLK